MTDRDVDPGVSPCDVSPCDASSSENDGVDLPRRDLMVKLGRFAYAAPALALLTRPKFAQADYGGGRGGPRDGSGSGPRDRG